MPEYHILRAVVALLCAVAAHKSTRYTRAVLAAQGLWCAFPALAKAEWWKVWVAVPLLCGVTATSALWLIDSIRNSVIGRRERALLFAICLLFATAIVSRWWWWEPHRWIQAIMAIRQYVAIGVAFAALFSWLYLRVSYPAQSRLTGWWVLWLSALALLSATGASGLLWSVLPWKHHLWAQRAVNAAGLLVQIGLLLNLRHSHAAPAFRWPRFYRPSPGEFRARTDQAGQIAHPAP